MESRRGRKPSPKIEADSFFKSDFLAWVILILLIMFNAFVFKGCFVIAYPKGMLGEGEIEGMVYGLGIALIISKIMFHENWEDQKGKSWSAGYITLLLNTILVCLYFNPLGFPSYWHSLALRIVMILLPVLGLLIITISLQKTREEDAF